MRPYELLVRFKNDGTVAGAQARYLETVNGRDFELDPVPLNVAGTEFSSFASQFSAAAIAERDAAITAKNAAIHERDTKAALVEGLEQQLADALAELDAIKNPPGPDLTTIDGVKAYISSERYKKETGGILIEEQPISTERDETGHWLGRFLDARAWLANDPTARSINPQGQYPYKPKGGEPVMLTANQVVRAYLCIAWYINACFAVEDFLYTQLNARIPLETVLSQIVWPQNNFKWNPPQ